MAQKIDIPKQRKVEMVGVYTLPESVQKINSKDGKSYEVPRGEYPVIGMLSEDGKSIQKAGIVFSAPGAKNDALMDIVEMLRPIDVPAMVQRREISMKSKADRSLEFPLTMFIGDNKKQAQTKTQAQAQAAVPENSMKKARSV